MVSWVTQLVVHPEYESIGVARNLLASVFGFSDGFGWGLVTANPRAVRALEKATRRRVDPDVVCENVALLRDIADESVPYVAGGFVHCGTGRAVIDTRFFLDHRDLPRLVGECSTAKGLPWPLGGLYEGEEWMAFTFGHQKEFPLTANELDVLLRHSQDKLKEAYERMALDERHVWAQYAAAEADFLVRELHLTTGAKVLDVGCGTGRHAREFARRGAQVLGVDNVRSFIEYAARRATDEHLLGCRFQIGDARTFDVGQDNYDVVLALYDVVGSYPEENDNQAILDMLARHVRPGGHVVLSVMSMELTAKKAIHVASVRERPEALLRLPASTKMETSGEVFDPDYYLLDLDAGLVYRKEQFARGNQLPTEIIVRDRRYRKPQIEAMVRACGLDVLCSRYVRAGRFETETPADTAKEILVVARRPGIGERM
jgi:2-polyprenyl-3-methyl-5-hydroxy-6-metoxy-1,4-benzoquinol methylase